MHVQQLIATPAQVKPKGEADIKGEGNKEAFLQAMSHAQQSKSPGHNDALIAMAAEVALEELAPAPLDTAGPQELVAAIQQQSKEPVPVQVTELLTANQALTDAAVNTETQALAENAGSPENTLTSGEIQQAAVSGLQDGQGGAVRSNPVLTQMIRELNDARIDSAQRPLQPAAAAPVAGHLAVDPTNQTAGDLARLAHSTTSPLRDLQTPAANGAESTAALRTELPSPQDKAPAPVATSAGLIESASPAQTSAAQNAPNSQAAQPITSSSIILQAQVDSEEWRQEMGQQLIKLVGKGDQRVSMHLNPVELGPLSVDLKVVEKQVQLQFLSGHAPVRAAVEQALPQLRDALSEQGMTLSESSVGEQSQFAQQQEQNRSGQTGATQGASERLDEQGEQIISLNTPTPSLGAVDRYV